MSDSGPEPAEDEQPSPVQPVIDLPRDLHDFDAVIQERLRAMLPLGGTSSRMANRDLALIEGSGIDSPEQLTEARAWQRRRFDAGMGWITGPPELGGAGLSADHERLYQNREVEHGAPDTSAFIVSRKMIVPAILRHGSEQLRERTLRPLLRGDLLGCQLFSEPDAGSDLAGVRTRATRAGDEWIITGHKVWSSVAHLADVGEVLVRTDPDAPKHAGLTMFLIDMDSPGITVRPLRQMSGTSEFNEVFLDGVRVRDEARVGGVGEGWQVALSTLTSERGAASSGDAVRRASPFDRLASATVGCSPRSPSTHRDRLARLYAEERVTELFEMRLQDLLATGGAEPVLSSISKLRLIRQLSLASELAGGILGPGTVAGLPCGEHMAWARFMTELPGLRIAGGTDEIVRNVLAERVLGLPRR